MFRNLLFVGTVLLFAPLAVAQEKTAAASEPLPAGAVTRIGSTRYWLPDHINSASARVAPDGRHLAALTIHGAIDVWQLPAWTKCRRLEPQSAPGEEKVAFEAFTFTPDGSTVVAADSAHRLVFIDIATGKYGRVISLPAEFQLYSNSIVISPDCKTLICTGHQQNDKEWKHESLVWDLKDGKLTHSIRVPVMTTSAALPISPVTRQSCPSYGLPFFGGGPSVLHALSGDCRWLAIGNVKNPVTNGRGYFLEFWNCKTAKRDRKITIDAVFNRMVMSPNGKWLAVCLRDEPTIRLHDVATGKEVHNLRQADSWIVDIVFAPDSQSFFVFEGAGAKISRWDAASGEKLATHVSPIGNVAQQLVFPASAAPLAFAQVNRIVHGWELTTGKLISLKDTAREPVASLHFADNGELFLGTEIGLLSWWNPRTGRKLRDLKLQALEGETGPHRLAFAPHGEFMLHFDRCDSSRAGAAISDARTGKHLYNDESKSPETVCLFARGQKTASLQGKAVRIWNTRSGRDLERFVVPMDEPGVGTCMAVCESGRYFAMVFTVGGSGARLILWDHEKRAIRRVWPLENSYSGAMPCFSADGQWLAFVERTNSVRLVHLGSFLGDSTLELRPDESIRCMAFARDGRKLACATHVDSASRRAGRMAVWEIASRKIRQEFSGHTGATMNALAYAPDGLLASAASDTTVVVWQAGLARPTGPAVKCDPELLFEQLASDDAGKAFVAMARLARSPEQAVSLLSARIAPARADLKGRSVADWIRDLGNSNYAVRVRASTLLFRLGPSVDADLQKAQSQPWDLETRRRIEDLRGRLAARTLTREEILHVRGIEVLEAIATPGARKLLAHWTTGDHGAVLTEQARASLQRR